MRRISPLVEKLEDRLNRKLDRLKSKGSKKLRQYAVLIAAGWYVYGMFINSIILGTAATFPRPGAEPVETIWVWNPIRNLIAIFTPTGICVTLFCILMTCLITKKGYNWFSGYYFKRDPRGFDILPDATHGTSGWLDSKGMELLLDKGSAAELNGTIIGKQKQSKDDSDKYAEYLSPKPDNQLNRHMIVYGASGSGKSRGFVKPFIIQVVKRRESLICVDPKGELFEATAEYLRNQGYVVKAYNLLDMENSDGFNCLSAIADDKSLVQTIAEVIIKNTSNSNERQDFWEKAEMNLLMALLHYVQNRCDPLTGELLPVEERSLGIIYEILSTKSFQDIEEIFSQLPKNHPAQAPYGIFRLANRQIWGNIAIGLGNRLGVFQNQLVHKITQHDEIDLVLPGLKPCAYFCIISAQDSSLEFLSSMFFSLLFTRLPNYARKNCAHGRLPVPVNVMLEEFCNIGRLVDFKKTISVCRSFNIHCQIIIQGIAQLSDRYENKEWEEIIGNCDTQIFLGCNDQMTAKYISDKCGMVTIRTTTSQIPMQPLFSPVYNSTKPYSQGRSNAQRPLMYPDELLRLDNSQEIVLFRGQNPLQLYKIIPEELLGFEELKPCRVVDYIPAWRRLEEEKEKQAAKTVKSSPPEPEPSISYAPQAFVEPQINDNRTDALSEEKPLPQKSPQLPSDDGIVMRRYNYTQVRPEEISQAASESLRG